MFALLKQVFVRRKRRLSSVVVERQQVQALFAEATPIIKAFLLRLAEAIAAREVPSWSFVDGPPRLFRFSFEGRCVELRCRDVTDTSPFGVTQYVCIDGCEVPPPMADEFTTAFVKEFERRYASREQFKGAYMLRELARQLHPPATARDLPTSGGPVRKR